MIADIAREPAWLQAWIWWLAGINLASILFLRRPEARWVALAFVALVPLMTMLYEVFGYSRILGVGHIAVWPPLLVYLAFRFRAWWPPRQTSSVYLGLLFVTNAISLVIDYADLVRYLLARV